MPSIGTLFCILGLVYVLLSLSKAVYRLFFHPLRSVPGPLLARISAKWLSYYEIAGSRTSTLDRVHEKYGPVIRIAPDELCFADPAVIKEIYSQGTQFMKSPFYNGLNEGIPNLFDGIDREAHRERRKLLGHAFAKSSITESEPLMVEQIQKFIVWLQRKEGHVLNVYVWFRMLSLDIVSSLFMGRAVGALDSDTEHEYLSNLDCHMQKSGLRWQLPWLLPLTSWIPLKRWQHFLTSSQRLYAYGQRSFEDYVARYGRDSSRNDMLKKVLAGDKTVKPMTDVEICAEIGSEMIGGTDTTSITLTFTAWELAKQPHVQETMRKELRGLGLDPDSGVPRYADLEKLKYLDAVLMEGLRLHPASPGGLPRVAPKGGARVAGVWVPGGTTVSMMNYSTHHIEHIFPNPCTFDPSRWLTPEGGTAEMREAYMPFSRGSRACLGIHFATMELKLILATIVNGWELCLGERTTDDTMSMTDHWVLMPKGGFCDLYFRKIKI